MKARPIKTKHEIRGLLSDKTHAADPHDPGSKGDTPDPAGSGVTLRTFDGLPLVMTDADKKVANQTWDENRALAIAIQDAFTRTKTTNPDRFVLTWRMYPNQRVAAGTCGCGCGCG
jgi:hypothetical protein